MKSLRSVIVLIMLATTTLTTSGCLDSGADEEGAHERAEIAVAALASAFATSSDSDLKTMEGTLQASAEADTGMGIGESDVQADVKIEWGQNDVRTLAVSMGDGGFTVQFETYCTPTRVVVVWGGEAYEGRAPNNTSRDGLVCMAAEGFDLSDAESMLDSATLHGLEQQDVTPNGDGTLSAVYVDHVDNTTYTLTIDDQDRVTRMEMAGPDGDGHLDLTYGTRDRIDLPEPVARIPANVEYRPAFMGTTFTGQITESPVTPALDEMELHVTQYDWENHTHTVFATFDAAGGSASDGEWSFTYTDADADGTVSVNDTFELQHSERHGDWWDYDIDFYDTWAEAYVNESPIPAPGAALLLAALIGLVLAAKRRTH